MPNYQALKAIALAGLACLPSLAYGQKDAVNLFPRGSTRGTTLIPYNLPRPLVKRDQVPIAPDHISLPKLGEAVELVYGEDAETNNPFVTKIDMLPAHNRAILLLEEYIFRPSHTEGILKEVKCEGADSAAVERVVLDMVVSGKKVETFNQWVAHLSKDKVDELVVVTSDGMRGCGNKERKAFLVNSVNIEGTLTTLGVTPIEWSSVASKISVEFGKLSTTSLHKRFLEDLFDGGDGTEFDGLISFKPEMNKRLKLFPLPNILPKINTGLPFDIPFLPEEDGQNTTDKKQPALTVTCIDCAVSGELGYHGKLDADMISKTGPKIDSAYIVLNVTKDLVAPVNLEVATSEEPISYSFQQSIFPALGSQDGIMLPSFGVAGIVEIRPYFDYAIGGSIEIQAPKVNVTFSGELRVRKGASLRWDLVNESSSQSGWDVDATVFPMKVNEPGDTGAFAVGLNISSIPSLLMNLEIAGVLPGDSPIQIGAKLAMILPRIYTKATLVKEVTSKCAALGPTDYTYFPYGINFESGLYMALIGELFATVDFDFGGKGNVSLSAGVAYEHTIWEHTVPFKPSCFLFGDSKTGKGVLRNSTSPEVLKERKLNLKAIEQKFKETGLIPDGVDLTELANMDGLSDKLKAALGKLRGSKDTGNNTLNTSTNTTTTNSGVKLREGSAWTMAIIAFGAAMF